MHSLEKLLRLLEHSRLGWRFQIGLEPAGQGVEALPDCLVSLVDELALQEHAGACVFEVRHLLELRPADGIEVDEDVRHQDRDAVAGRLVSGNVGDVEIGVGVRGALQGGTVAEDQIHLGSRLPQQGPGHGLEGLYDVVAHSVPLVRGPIPMA